MGDDHGGRDACGRANRSPCAGVPAADRRRAYGRGGQGMMLEFRGIRKTFVSGRGEVPAVCGVDLEVLEEALRPSGTQRLRQVHGPLPCGGAAEALLGGNPVRRRVGGIAREEGLRLPQGAQRGDGLPELRAVPSPGRVREHRLPPARRRREGGIDQCGSDHGRGHARNRGVAPRPTGRALRRPAPTGCDRPCDRAKAPPLSPRRAAIEPRRRTAGRNPGGAETPPARTGRHHAVRHARPDGSDDAR